MRLLRRAITPSNGGLCQKCQHYRIIEASRSHIHNALLGKSNLTHGPNLQWLPKLYAVSTLPDTVDVRKPRRVVSRNERKSLVENYVMKYRELNAGKFPFISEVQKEVGGNFYIIRNIIQELEHESLVNAKVTTTFVRGRLKISADTREVSQPDSVDEGVSRISENDQSDDIGTPPYHPTDKSARSLEPKLPSHMFQLKTVPHESIESGTSNRKSDQVHGENAEAESRSSIWQNLKSFASGIFGKWKGS